MEDTWELSEMAKPFKYHLQPRCCVWGAPGHPIQPHLQHCPPRAAGSSDVPLFLCSWAVAWSPVLPLPPQASAYSFFKTQVRWQAR